LRQAHRDYPRIWNNFIPFTYRQVFQRGAYYAKEVFPDELAIISLNTLYFYDSNSGACSLFIPFTAISDNLTLFI
jgi:endopolyphosphatase